MSVSIKCTECGVKIKAPEKAIGRKVKCPKCKQPFLATPVDAAAIAAAAVPEVAPAPVPAPAPEPEPEPEPTPTPAPVEPAAVSEPEPAAIEEPKAVTPEPTPVAEPDPTPADGFLFDTEPGAADAAPVSDDAPDFSGFSPEADADEIPDFGETEPADDFASALADDDADPFDFIDTDDAAAPAIDAVAPAIGAVAPAIDVSEPVDAVVATPIDAVGAVDEWTMKTPDGSEYGPISRDELNAWVAEDRVDAECHLMDGNTKQWVPAAAVYPQLGGGAVADAVVDAVPVDAIPDFDAAASDAVGSVTDAAGGAFGAIGDVAGGAVGAVGDAASGVAGAVGDTASGAMAAVTGGAAALAGGAAVVAATATDAVAAPIATAVGTAGQGSPVAAGAFSPDLVKYVKGMRPWTMLVGVLLLLFAALGAITGVLSLVGGVMAGNMPAAIGAGLLPTIVALIYGLLGVSLFKFAGAAKSFAANPQMESLTKAMKSQNTFWRVVGILLLLGFIVMIAGIGIAFAVGLGEQVINAFTLKSTP